MTAQNKSKCRRSLRHGAGDLGEFISRPYRIMFFEDHSVGNLIVLTHWFEKKRDDTPQSEINRASRLRAAYFEWKS